MYNILLGVYFDGSLGLTVTICHWNGYLEFIKVQAAKKKIKYLFFKKHFWVSAALP